MRGRFSLCSRTADFFRSVDIRLPQESRIVASYHKLQRPRVFSPIICLLLSVGILFIQSGCSSSKPTYAISGTVTSGGSALAGVTINLAGGSSGTATTDANGNYTLSDIPIGTYTLTPSLTGYTFAPPNRPVFLDGLDAVGFNFSIISEGRTTTATHTVHLKSDGSVWAWGNNANGQLGNGTTTNSAVPVQLSGLSGVKTLAAGNDYTVSLKSDGSVWAWGNNTNGQLGNGTTTQSATPLQVTGLTGVTAIAAGYDHTVALVNDGSVWAWGNNSNGQLGDGSTTQRNGPVQVGGVIGATAIAAGNGYTMVLASNSTVWAWGNNSNFQLGNGTATSSVTPVQVSGLSAVRAISASSGHAIALLTDGTVRTWGANAMGQLGNGTINDSSLPVKTTHLVNSETEAGRRALLLSR
jgi:hypothetical protein